MNKAELSALAAQAAKTMPINKIAMGERSVNESEFYQDRKAISKKQYEEKAWDLYSKWSEHVGESGGEKYSLSFATWLKEFSGLSNGEIYSIRCHVGL